MKKFWKLFLILTLTSCVSQRLATSLELISFSATSAPGPRQDLGAMRAQDCTTRVAGLGPAPKIDTALANLQKQHPDLVYLSEFRLHRRYKNYVFWTQDCYEVAGYGNK